MNKGMVGILSSLVGAGVGVAATGKKMGEKVNQWQQMSDKHLSLFLMMNQWVKVKQAGKNLAEYFDRKGYKNIAVYGMSYAGETLIDELKDTGVTVRYAIDKNADKIYSDIDVITMEDDLQEVDAIVVTAITFFEEIESKLSEKIDCPIISLEDVLYDV